MFEEILSKLDGMGVQYQEDPESGSVTIDVTALDKTQLLEVVIMANGSGFPFTLDDTTLVISLGPTSSTPSPMEAPMEPEGDYQAMAMDEMAGQM
jgi:hypothetical protein